MTLNKEQVDDVIKRAEPIRPLTEIDEREILAILSSEVEVGGLIVEIGCLYGGTTGVLALANPEARVQTIDTFEWHPPEDVETSPALLYKNMEKIGASNVEVIEGDSRVIWKQWTEPIDLLFVDGGHSYEWVFSDLSHFAPHTQVIALHDYDNPFWKTIREAVEDFLDKHPLWYLDKVVGTVAVLRRK